MDLNKDMNKLHIVLIIVSLIVLSGCVFQEKITSEDSEIQGFLDAVPSSWKVEKINETSFTLTSTTSHTAEVEITETDEYQLEEGFLNEHSKLIELGLFEKVPKSDTSSYKECYEDVDGFYYCSKTCSCGKGHCYCSRATGKGKVTVTPSLQVDFIEMRPSERVEYKNKLAEYTLCMKKAITPVQVKIMSDCGEPIKDIFAETDKYLVFTKEEFCKSDCGTLIDKQIKLTSSLEAYFREIRPEQLGLTGGSSSFCNGKWTAEGTCDGETTLYGNFSFSGKCFGVIHGIVIINPKEEGRDSCSLTWDLIGKRVKATGTLGHMDCAPLAQCTNSLVLKNVTSIEVTEDRLDHSICTCNKDFSCTSKDYKSTKKIPCSSDLDCFEKKISEYCKPDFGPISRSCIGAERLCEGGFCKDCDCRYNFKDIKC